MSAGTHGDDTAWVAGARAALEQRQRRRGGARKPGRRPARAVTIDDERSLGAGARDSPPPPQARTQDRRREHGGKGRSGLGGAKTVQRATAAAGSGGCRLEALLKQSTAVPKVESPASALGTGHELAQLRAKLATLMPLLHALLRAHDRERAGAMPRPP